MAVTCAPCGRDSAHLLKTRSLAATGQQNKAGWRTLAALGHAARAGSRTSVVVDIVKLATGREGENWRKSRSTGRRSAFKEQNDRAFGECKNANRTKMAKVPKETVQIQIFYIVAPLKFTRY